MKDVSTRSGRSVFAIVLAAGESARFGATKQLEQFDGEALVGRALRIAEETCGERSILVVGNRWKDVLAACAPLRGFFINNEDFGSGIASSITSAVRAVAHCADAVLLMLADQPLIGSEYLRSAIGQWQEDPGQIVISEHSGVQGPPAIFPAACFQDLTALRGDQGARRVVTSGKYRVCGLPCEEASVDIDAPGDLDRLRNG